MSSGTHAEATPGGQALRPFPSAAVFRALLDHFGPQDWWPGETMEEIATGAILTQHTAWPNVERALASLRENRALDFRCLAALPTGRLASMIRSAGTHRIKARRLKTFSQYLCRNYGGSLEPLVAQPDQTARRVLLSIPGIGPETADCILLYGGKRPVFVIDAYTRRFMQRHRWASRGQRYDELARCCRQGLPPDPALFNEYHALIVRLGKTCCRGRSPHCAACPLRRRLPRNGPDPV